MRGRMHSSTASRFRRILNSGDVNGDGNINASDAAVVLIYAAAGAGQDDAKISDFVH